jgi:subtilisin family serine protease
VRTWRRTAVVVALVLPTLWLRPASAAQAPNDPEFPKQYGPVQVGALDAWSKTKGEGVLVAVVDSGVDVDHPDLKDKLVIRPGSDLADGDDDPDDDSELQDGEGKAVRGHGTGGAGVIAATTNNSIGIAGVAPEAKILPVKVFPSNPNQGIVQGFSAIPNGIRFAVSQGAKVINLSVGTIKGFGSLVGAIESPCRDAYAQGAICVVASGNDRANNPSSGYANDVDFLIVTANDKEAKGATFAQNADTKWAVSAPGVGVFTTTALENGNGGYAEVNGTSFSAPHAAGVAALLFAQGLKAPEVVQRLLATARPMGEPTRYGAGLVDAAAAVGVARTEVSGETPQQEATNSSILLPKAATRTPTPTTAPARGAAAPSAASPTPAAASAPAAPAADQGGYGDTDFNADLTGATSDEALGLGPEPAASREELTFYMLAMLAGTFLLGTGLGLWSRLRARRFERLSA